LLTVLTLTNNESIPGTLKEALNKVILAREGTYKVLILLDPLLLGDYESDFNQRLIKESLNKYNKCEIIQPHKQTVLSYETNHFRICRIHP